MVAATRSSRAVPTDLNTVIAAGSVRPGCRPAHRPCSSRADALARQGARSDREQDVAGLRHRTLERVDEHLAAAHHRVVALAHLRREAADQVDMGARPQPGAPHQRLAAQRGAGDDVGAAHGRLEIVDHRHRHPSAAELGGHRLGPRPRAVPQPDLARSAGPRHGRAPDAAPWRRRPPWSAPGRRAGPGTRRPAPRPRRCGGSSARRRPSRPAACRSGRRTARRGPAPTAGPWSRCRRAMWTSLTPVTSPWRHAGISSRIAGSCPGRGTRMMMPRAARSAPARKPSRSASTRRS